MDPETKRLLEDSLILSRENNEMLKKIVRNQKIANMYRIFYWSIIILSSAGAYYFIKPYLGNIFNVYSGGVSNIGNIGDISKSLNNKQQVDDLLKLLNQ